MERILGMGARRSLAGMMLMLVLAACQGPAAPAGVPTGTVAAEGDQATRALHTDTAPAPVELMPTEAGLSATATNGPLATGAASSPSATAAPEAGAWQLPQVKSLTVVAGPGERVYLLAGSGHDLHLHRSDDGGQTFRPPVLVSAGSQAEVLGVVRPALDRRPDGALSAAWVETSAGGQSQVRATLSTDGGQTFSEPATIASTSDPETTMATVKFTEAGSVVVTWLQDSTLRLAVSAADGLTFGPPVVIDDLVCECCQPQPLAIGDALYVAYRNLVEDPTGQVRDIHVAASRDGGAHFSAPVPVSEASWHINACPIAGPELAAAGSTLYAAWMDGRFDDGMFSRTDIWLASSTDGGASFGANVRVNDVEGNYNGQPAMTLDRLSRLHVAWTADTAEGPAILYTESTDKGATFAPSRTVVSGMGRLGSPVLAASEVGRVYLAWTDADGGYLTVIE